MNYLRYFLKGSFGVSPRPLLSFPTAGGLMMPLSPSLYSEYSVYTEESRSNDNVERKEQRRRVGQLRLNSLNARYTHPNALTLPAVYNRYIYSMVQ